VVYVAGAENDHSFTPEQAEMLDKALTAAGVEHTIEFYPAAHGFAVPDNGTYNADAAARHWTATKDFFGSALPR
jgi:carboxymethylenebutenolidase